MGYVMKNRKVIESFWKWGRDMVSYQRKTHMPLFIFYFSIFPLNCFVSSWRWWKGSRGHFMQRWISFFLLNQQIEDPYLCFQLWISKEIKRERTLGYSRGWVDVYMVRSRCVIVNDGGRIKLHGYAFEGVWRRLV